MLLQILGTLYYTNKFYLGIYEQIEGGNVTR